MRVYVMREARTILKQLDSEESMGELCWRTVRGEGDGLVHETPGERSPTNTNRRGGGRTNYVGKGELRSSFLLHLWVVTSWLWYILMYTARHISSSTQTHTLSHTNSHVCSVYRSCHTCTCCYVACSRDILRTNLIKSQAAHKSLGHIRP